MLNTAFSEWHESARCRMEREPRGCFLLRVEQTNHQPPCWSGAPSGSSLLLAFVSAGGGSHQGDLRPFRLYRSVRNKLDMWKLERMKAFSQRKDRANIKFYPSWTFSTWNLNLWCYLRRDDWPFLFYFIYLILTSESLHLYPQLEIFSNIILAWRILCIKIHVFVVKTNPSAWTRGQNVTIPLSSVCCHGNIKHHFLDNKSVKHLHISIINYEMSVCWLDVTPVLPKRALILFSCWNQSFSVLLEVSPSAVVSTIFGFALFLHSMNNNALRADESTWMYVFASLHVT